jgi:hypothetical protein
VLHEVVTGWHLRKRQSATDRAQKRPSPQKFS